MKLDKSGKAGDETIEIEVYTQREDVKAWRPLHARNIFRWTSVNTKSGGFCIWAWCFWYNIAKLCQLVWNPLCSNPYQVIIACIHGAWSLCVYTDISMDVTKLRGLVKIWTLHLPNGRKVVDEVVNRHFFRLLILLSPKSPLRVRPRLNDVNVAARGTRPTWDSCEIGIGIGNYY